MDLTVIQVDTRKREIPYENNSFFITAQDPYGHFKISRAFGVTHEALEGSFTRFEYAMEKVEDYVDKDQTKKNKPKKKPLPKRPE